MGGIILSMDLRVKFFVTNEMQMLAALVYCLDICIDS